jgi:hypothetical protein
MGEGDPSIVINTKILVHQCHPGKVRTAVMSGFLGGVAQMYFVLAARTGGRSGGRSEQEVRIRRRWWWWRGPKSEEGEEIIIIIVGVVDDVNNSCK